MSLFRPMNTLTYRPSESGQKRNGLRIVRLPTGRAILPSNRKFLTASTKFPKSMHEKKLPQNFKGQL